MKKHSTVVITAILIAMIMNPALANWTTPVPITELNTTASESYPYLSADYLTIYFDRMDSTTHGCFQLFKATRNTVNGEFTSVSSISELNVIGHDVTCPWISQDGLRLYYSEHWEFKVSTRASLNAVWSSGQPLSELNVLGSIEDPKLSAGECSIVFHSPFISDGKGGYDLYTASRPNTSVPFENIRNLSELNTSGDDVSPSLSADGLTIYFTSTQSLIYKATRSSVNDFFGAPEVMSFPAGFTSAISMDGSTMLLEKNYDLYVSTIPEPTTLLLLGLGSLVSALRRKRR
jgi:hypothetical protein